MTTLLAIGDVHLGRTPSALHPDLLSQRSELGPETAWNRCVDLAIKRGVDGVLLAGDVVERSRDLLVAYGDLKQGIDKLAAAGIAVVAVAGNHDTLVLPQLAAEIEDLHLLGAGGCWQERTIGKLRILGWSFPQPRVRRNPLEDFPRLDHSDNVIGLLHCDRDQKDSPYAPVSSRDLADAPVAAWLLGHIHHPDSLTGKRPAGYLGSVTALRASETGPRGPWLIDWNGTDLNARHLPLAPLRFESLPLDLGELQTEDELAGAALAAARRHVENLAPDQYLPDVIGLRLMLTGRCRFERRLDEAAEQLISEARPWREGPVRLFIQKVVIATEAAHDLERLARQSDPCGLLAQRILRLQNPDHPAHEALIEQARFHLAEVANQREFRELDQNLDDHQVRDWLIRASRIALNELLAQKRADS